MQTTAHDTNDIVAALIAMKGMKMEEMLARLRAQFPGSDQDQIGTAIRKAHTAMIKQAASDFEEADALDDLLAMRREPQ